MLASSAPYDQPDLGRSGSAEGVRGPGKRRTSGAQTLQRRATASAEVLNSAPAGSHEQLGEARRQGARTVTSKFACQFSLPVGHSSALLGHLEDVMSAIGTKPEQSRIQSGRPPVILQAQVDGFVRLTTREELQQWQNDLKTYYGISMDASNLAGIAGECCCAGCSDQCDLIA
jgi:hypothetical protein